MSHEFYVIPSTGMFKVTVTPTYDRNNKNKLLYYVLNIGGNTDKCVNFTIHSEKSPNEKVILLSWTEVLNKECTIDSEAIKGNKTVEMLRLAITIAKDIAPYAEYIKLDDMSYFMCETPNGKQKVSLPPYHIAFHDKTWYEDKMKATMMNTDYYTKYQEYIQNMYKEGIMPNDFNFGNASLREILYPLYTKSKTWKQFFKLIEKEFPDKKCIVMYPWINTAMNIIFENNKLFVGQAWKINIQDTPMIRYYEVDRTTVRGGGFDKQYLHQAYNHNDVDYGKVMDWNFNTILKKKNMKSKTRKNNKKH
jgi:hypothetical protein